MTELVLGSAFVLLLLLAGVVTGLKGKWGFLALGLFIAFPFWIFGAFRLAKPGSVWARRFYDDTKRKRAWARYEDYAWSWSR